MLTLAPKSLSVDIKLNFHADLLNFDLNNSTHLPLSIFLSPFFLFLLSIFLFLCFVYLPLSLSIILSLILSSSVSFLSLFLNLTHQFQLLSLTPHTCCFPYILISPNVVERMLVFSFCFVCFNHPSLLCDVTLSVAAKQWKKLKHGRLIATNGCERPVQKSREVR